ncbi:hypothetical protein Tco_0010902 [Tanacetum coccineum]
MLIARIQEFLNQVDSTIKIIIKDQVKAQVSKIMPKIEKYVTESLGAEVGRDDQDKDEDPSAGSDRGTKRRKSVSVHVEEPSHIVEDSGIQQDQEFVTGDNDEQPADKEVTKAIWFKKPKRPPTPDPDWSKRRQVNFRPPQTWISQAALAKEPHTSFDEFNDTSFDFSAFVMNRLKFLNSTHEFDLEYLKGGDLSRRYSTSMTKTKTATYKLKWIEDLVHELWSPVMFTPEDGIMLSPDTIMRRWTTVDGKNQILRTKHSFTSHSVPMEIILWIISRGRDLMAYDNLHSSVDELAHCYVSEWLPDIAAGRIMESSAMRK